MEVNDATCRKLRPIIDAHFACRNREASELLMRAHLPECAACREHYERNLLLARLDPRSPSAEDRLAESLGLRSSRSPGWQLPVVALAAAAAALAAVAVAPTLYAPERSGFTARGAAESSLGTELLAFRLEKGGAPSRLVEGMAISPSDELGFAYRNAGQKRHLLVFGVDERRRVYWYHPAWTDARTDPTAVAIETGEARRELPEAISHRLEGSSLRIVALFTDQALSVRELEALLARHPDLAAPLAIPGAIQRSITLRIGR